MKDGKRKESEEGRSPFRKTSRRGTSKSVADGYLVAQATGGGLCLRSDALGGYSSALLAIAAAKAALQENADRVKREVYETARSQIEFDERVNRIPAGVDLTNSQVVELFNRPGMSPDETKKE